ncbi:hypothetical protein [Streptomyces sp. NPDC007905]
MRRQRQPTDGDGKGGKNSREDAPDTTVAPDNGLNGWDMSWSAWAAGSAA